MFWSHMQDAAAPDGLDKFGRSAFSSALYQNRVFIYD